MRRRRFLATAGVVATFAVAGCVDDGDDEDDGGAGGEPPAERVDQPPHDPERPPRPDPGDEDEWNENWLGEGMATEPTLAFEQVATPLRDRQLDQSPSPVEPAYAITPVTTEDELEARVEMDGASDRLEAVDFGEELVVIVESGYGSSSVGHRWRRVEAVDAGIYLHGHYTDPLVQTADHGPRHSVVVVETTLDEDDLAYASLTVGEDRRVNFDSGDGVVTLDGNG